MQFTYLFTGIFIRFLVDFLVFCVLDKYLLDLKLKRCKYELVLLYNIYFVIYISNVSVKVLRFVTGTVSSCMLFQTFATSYSSNNYK